MFWSLLSAAVPDVPPGGPLPVCPGKPNCVCSEDGTPADRRVDPFPIAGSEAGGGDAPGDPHAAWGLLKNAVRDLGGDVKADDGETLHAVFTTPVLRFPDDFHARLDGANGTVQVRGASRVGRKDFGTNRKRIEKLRTVYLAKLEG